MHVGHSRTLRTSLTRSPATPRATRRAAPRAVPAQACCSVPRRALMRALAALLAIAAAAAVGDAASSSPSSVPQHPSSPPPSLPVPPASPPARVAPPPPAGGASFWPGPPAGAGDCAAALATQPICEDAAGGVSIFFTGEFGTELLVALPAAFAAWERGVLVATHGCGDMRPFYYFSPNHTDVHDCKRSYRPHEFAAFHWVPHQATRPDAAHWRPPPLRAHYRRRPAPALPPGAPWRLDDAGDTRPLVVLHNKHNTEWGGPPVNTFSLELLEGLLDILAPLPLRLLYTRPSGPRLDDAGSPGVTFEDAAWLRARAPAVLQLSDVVAANDGALSLNELQVALFARADHAISVQGGPALLLAQFLGAGGDLVVLHKRGGEDHSKGGSEYASLFPAFDGAAVTVAHSDDELLAAVARLAPQWAVE